MTRYLRRSRTELKHRYDEFFEATGRRRDCPLEVKVRSRVLDFTRDTVALIEAALLELRRQEAMFCAPFKPGDRVVEQRDVEGVTRIFGPYLILDVCPDKRCGYHYEAARLTKSGSMHKRGSTQWLFPRASSSIRLSDAPVCEDAEWEARYYRECAQTARTLAFEAGDLSLFEVVEGAMGRRHFRRKDRMSP
jgi:hypothetical protein